MLIPPRVQDEWVSIEGTRTTYADPATVVVSRIVHDTAASNVVLAYPASPIGDPIQRGVRIDFLWVVQLGFSSFDGPDPAGSEHIPRRFALSVSDRSAYKRKLLATLEDFEWGRTFSSTPEGTLRHFHIVFDDYGRFDVLAAHGEVRGFELSPLDSSNDRPAWKADPTAAHAAREIRLLRDALALPRPSLPPELLS